MGLFSKNKAGDSKNIEIGNEVISSIIDKSMTLFGEMKFSGKTRIDGIINGDVEGEHLVISENGVIYGDVRVNLLNCYGMIKGNVTAEVACLRKSCQIKGAVMAKDLTVEEGAAILGEIRSAKFVKEEESLLIDQVVAGEEQEKQKNVNKIVDEVAQGLDTLES